MFDKIFNRKYIKAKIEIEEQIEFLKGKEDYYHQALYLSKSVDEYKEAIAWIELYRYQREGLENMLRDLKTVLH